MKARRVFLLTASAVLLEVCLVCPATAAIRVVMRMDDYCTGVSLERMEEVFQVLREESVPLTVGVVPAVATDGNLNTNGTRHSILSTPHGELLAKWFKTGVIEVAIHGYEHRNRGTDEIRSEFQGMERERQVTAMERGRAIVAERTGASSRIFLPPWNRFDYWTLRAAASNGFPILSAMLPVPGQEDAETLALTFLPVSGGVFEIERALANARRSGDPDPVLVIQFHVDDFRPHMEDTLTIPRLRLILRNLKRQPDVVFATMEGIRRSSQNPTVGDYRRLAEWEACWARQRHLVPRFLRVDVEREFPADVASSPGHLRWVVTRYIVELTVFYLVCVVLVGAACLLAARHFSRRRHC